MNIAHTLAHYFIPRRSNNHKAKLIHSSVIFLLTLLLLGYQVILKAIPHWRPQVLGYAANISTSEVIALTNQKRMEAGLSTLQYSDTLAKAAHAKGEHMLQNDYWAHVAPDGTEPWSFFTNAGYSYKYAGENLARDFSSASSAVDAWMASPSHKDNMLSNKYQEIGIAVVEGDLAGVDTTIIVQLFGTRLLDTIPASPVAAASPDEEVLTSPTLSPEPTPTTAVVAKANEIPNKQENSQDIVGPSGQISKTEVSAYELFSPFDTTRGVSLATIFLLSGVMVVDGVVTFRKKTSRVSGRIFAHLAFFGMLISIILIAHAGKII